MAKQPKPFAPVIASANDLRAGQVLYRAASGRWTPAIDDAEIAADRGAADALLARARAEHDAAIVVEPALIEVARDGDALRPASLRERIRAAGPTVPLPPPA